MELRFKFCRREFEKVGILGASEFTIEAPTSVVKPSAALFQRIQLRRAGLDVLL